MIKILVFFLLFSNSLFSQTIMDQINIIENIKIDIREAIASQGVVIDENVPFASYSSLIGDIEGSNNFDTQLIHDVEVVGEVNTDDFVGVYISSGLEYGAGLRYEQTDDFDVEPGDTATSVEFSDDQQFLVVLSSCLETRLYSYRWNENSEQYEKTNDPDIDPPYGKSGVALSYDGTMLAVTHAGGVGDNARLTTYRWNEYNYRYEKTAIRDVAPSGTAIYNPALSSDGTMLAVPHYGSSGDAYLITYRWNEYNYRYEKTASPDVAPSGRSYGVDLSSDGTMLAVAHHGSSGDGTLITYVWNESNNRYEKTASPDDVPSEDGQSVGLSSDGTQLGLLLKRSGSCDRRLLVYQWNASNYRYENPITHDIEPSSGHSPWASFSPELHLIAVSNLTLSPYVYIYIRNDDNNQYEKIDDVYPERDVGVWGAAFTSDLMKMVVRSWCSHNILNIYTLNQAIDIQEGQLTSKIKLNEFDMDFSNLKAIGFVLESANDGDIIDVPVFWWAPNMFQE